MRLKEYLEQQKAGSTNDGILVLLRSRYLQDFCLAWRNADVEFKGDKSYKKPSLERCWQQCQYDLESISQVAGVPYSRSAQIFEQAKGLSLIYPDGSLNQNALRVLNQMAQQEIRRLTE